MKIGLEEVRKVAALARLSFSQEEEERLTQQLDKILQYMEKLNELDTESVDPLAQVVDIANVLREDTVVREPILEELLSNAPARESDFFKVPKIIE
jgi:aspartyl-tRNA(Asn)/glutamyl-tRNA(Gln) amidotransferase subunit C